MFPVYVIYHGRHFRSHDYLTLILNNSDILKAYKYWKVSALVSKISVFILLK